MKSTKAERRKSTGSSRGFDSEAVNVNEKKTDGRLWSLDAFRGFDMMFIMGVGTLLSAFAWWCSGLDWQSYWDTHWFAQQMKHVKWEGLHFYDMIFPTFIFIAGISFPFSYAKQKERGDSMALIHWRLLKRMLLLIALGILYNGLLRFEFPMRYSSVLGKIGIAWFVAALCYVHFGLKVRIGICAGMMIAYWLATRFILAPDAPSEVADPFSRLGCIAGWFDRTCLPGKLGGGNFDGAGPLINVAASVSAMLGMFTGDFIRRNDLSGNRKTLLMFAGAVGLLVLGLAFAQVFPVIKKIWSPSFALLCGAYSLFVFAIFYWIMDVKGWRNWAFPLRVIGLNSITIYLFQELVDVTTIVKGFVGDNEIVQKVIEGKIVPVHVAYGLRGFVENPALLALSFWIGYVVFCWLILWFLYRKQVFLKV